MAQRKKGAATRRGKTVKRRKAPKRVKAVQRKVAKRSATKARSRTLPTKAQTKRPEAKIVTPKKDAPRKRQGELPIEVVRVETVDEPAPGVVVVKEFASVRVRRPKMTAEGAKPQESSGIPESNGE